MAYLPKAVHPASFQELGLGGLIVIPYLPAISIISEGFSSFWLPSSVKKDSMPAGVKAKRMRPGADPTLR